MKQIGWEVEPKLDWLALTRAIAAGHERPRAEIGDTFLYRGPDTVLSRAAWIDGLGIAVKTATLFPGNDGPKVNGGVMLLSDRDGTLEATVDFHLLTKWKTAGDSLAGALRLARPDSERLTIVGAGTVAASLIEAYRAGFPGIEVTVWSRTQASAKALADRFGTSVADDLASAVGNSDIVACGTIAKDPVIKGEWLQPGTHLDLIGAFKPDMREADDLALQRARIFVDSRATTIGHIGELMIPLASGAITEADVLADFYDGPAMARSGADEITLFKNGGGAHLDLMTARYMLEQA